LTAGRFAAGINNESLFAGNYLLDCNVFCCRNFRTCVNVFGFVADFDGDESAICYQFVAQCDIAVRCCEVEVGAVVELDDLTGVFLDDEVAESVCFVCIVSGLTDFDLLSPGFNLRCLVTSTAVIALRPCPEFS